MTLFWFLYTKWKDVLVFDYGNHSHLLQGKKNKITRATHFRVAQMENTFGSAAAPRVVSARDLISANLWEALEGGNYENLFV